MNKQFMNLGPQLCPPEKAQYAVLPVPYEGTVSYMKGTALGPAAVIDASTQVEEFDEELLGDFCGAGVLTLPAVTAADTPEEMMSRIALAARDAMKDKFLLTLGGEHSITAPLVRTAAQRFGEISVLQIDAHADLRDSYEGTIHSHAAVMRRVLEITPRIAQVGIRNFSQEEYEQCPQQVKNFITPHVVHTDAAWIDRTLGLLGEQVYVTVDIDGFDPAYVPGTGTPEPGGLDWQEVTSLLRRVCTERKVVAADIVEVIPLAGQKVSEFLAARLAYKIIAYTQLKQR